MAVVSRRRRGASSRRQSAILAAVLLLVSIAVALAALAALPQSRDLLLKTAGLRTPAAAPLRPERLPEGNVDATPGKPDEHGGGDEASGSPTKNPEADEAREHSSNPPDNSAGDVTPSTPLPALTHCVNEEIEEIDVSEPMSDLSRRTLPELQYLRDEILARNGYAFRKDDEGNRIRACFEGRNWYHPGTASVPAIVHDLETLPALHAQNINFQRLSAFIRNERGPPPQ